jgi:hypothetical protein
LITKPLSKNLAGVGKNRRFDEVIDDEDFEDMQVICKRGDEEIPIAKPSRAFYFGDRNLYELLKFLAGKRGRRCFADLVHRPFPNTANHSDCLDFQPAIGIVSSCGQ